MKNRKTWLMAILIGLSIICLSACGGNDSEEVKEAVSKEETKGVSATEASEKSNEPSGSTDKVNNIEEQNEQKSDAEFSKAESEKNQDEHTIHNSKIRGKQEFLSRLDSIQKELDTLPEKEDSDKGVTNAMKNYYGQSYETYDKELNEIFALLKQELSLETMKLLQTEQLNWIKEKEEKATEEQLKYNGGTQENAAYYQSLYESTKERCYALVNRYMEG